MSNTNTDALKTEVRTLWSREKLQQQGTVEFLNYGHSMRPLICEGDLIVIVRCRGGACPRPTSSRATAMPPRQVAEEATRVAPTAETKRTTYEQLRIGDIILARSGQLSTGLIMHRIIGKHRQNGHAYLLKMPKFGLRILRELRKLRVLRVLRKHLSLNNLNILNSLNILNNQNQLGPTLARSYLVTQGDAARYPDPPIYVEDILGKVISVKRDRKTIRLDHGLYYGLSWALGHFAFLTRWINRSILRKYIGALLRHLFPFWRLIRKV